MNKKVDNKRFIEVWQTSISVQEVCNETKLTKSSAYSKAFRLRKIGVNLKRMPTYTARERQDLIEYANSLSGAI